MFTQSSAHHGKADNTDTKLCRTEYPNVRNLSATNIPIGRMFARDFVLSLRDDLTPCHLESISASSLIYA